MPVPIAAKAGVIAISVAVAAAIAVYESPELRRMAEDLRRRIAIALHSLGDNIDSPAQSSQEPLFNRPEDAEGFLRSRGGVVGGDDAGMDADDETRRRQREELMYWNAIRESKREMERKQAEERQKQNAPRRGSTFDDFLQADAGAERGTYVYNTGADVRTTAEQLHDGGLTRRRGVGVEGVRGLSPAIYANPFADENGVDDYFNHDEQAMSLHPLSPGHDEIMSDIYDATEPERYNNAAASASASRTLSPQAQPQQPMAEVLFDFSSHDQPAAAASSRPASELEAEYVTADESEHSRADVYASIQAWAEAASANTTTNHAAVVAESESTTTATSTTAHEDYNNDHRFPPAAGASSFYSPLPVSPPVPLSEPEMVSDDDDEEDDGMLTPTEGSVAGSGVDVADEVLSHSADVGGREVLSDDESRGGMATPSSWTDVGSVVSSSADEQVRA